MPKIVQMYLSWSFKDVSNQINLIMGAFCMCTVQATQLRHNEVLLVRCRMRSTDAVV